jgi:hypothetical protein
MPFKLTSEQARTKSKLTEELILAAADIDQAVTVYNDQVGGLRTPVETAVTKYNEILAKARDLCQNIAEEADQDLGDHDEEWLDTDRGQAAQSYQESWEEIELDDIDYQWPEELEIDITDHTTDLKDLPEEAE